MTSANGNIFRVTGHLCWEFTGVPFDLRLNKRLSKQSWGWWFETLSRPLWRHCYVHKFEWNASVKRVVKCTERCVLQCSLLSHAEVVWGCIRVCIHVCIYKKIDSRRAFGSPLRTEIKFQLLKTEAREHGTDGAVAPRCRDPWNGQLKEQGTEGAVTPSCAGTWYGQSKTTRKGNPGVIMLPGQNGHHFAGDIFILIFFNENCCILFLISTKFVYLKDSIDNKPALVQIMVWWLTGDKPLSRPIIVHFADDIFILIFFNENFCILFLISTKFFYPKGSVDNKPVVVQIMVWWLTGDKPLSWPIVVYFTDA